MEVLMKSGTIRPKVKAKSGSERNPLKLTQGVKPMKTAPVSPTKLLPKPKSSLQKRKSDKDDPPPLTVEDAAKVRKLRTLRKFKNSGGTGEAIPRYDSESKPPKSPTKMLSQRKLQKVDNGKGESLTTTLSTPMKTIVRVKSPRQKNEDGNVDWNTKYPVLNNEALVQQFLNVPMSNNQKGRIRQAIKDSLLGTSNAVVPSIVNNKIQSILRSSANLTDSQLRRVRILYNLLKTSLNGEQIVEEPPVKKVQLIDVNTQVSEKPRKKKRENILSPIKERDGREREQLLQKVRGPKRYVVFLGNLPLGVDKDLIMSHFSEMNEHILNIRIPKPKPEKRSAIAYLELSNEASYEYALSKHHSMLGKRRINVMYSMPKNGRVTKSEAKSKSAKLIALQKSGKLVGSIPLARKRSQRRLKQKQAKMNE